MTCEEWKKVYDRELAMTIKWKEQNCRKCPECKTFINRDGGCSHMVCRLCKYQFCWICLGKYQPGKYTMDNNGTCPCGSGQQAPAPPAPPAPVPEADWGAAAAAGDWAPAAGDWANVAEGAW